MIEHASIHRLKEIVEAKLLSENIPSTLNIAFPVSWKQ